MSLDFTFELSNRIKKLLGSRKQLYSDNDKNKKILFIEWTRQRQREKIY